MMTAADQCAVPFLMFLFAAAAAVAAYYGSDHFHAFH